MGGRVTETAGFIDRGEGSLGPGKSVSAHSLFRDRKLPVDCGGEVAAASLLLRSNAIDLFCSMMKVDNLKDTLYA